MFALIHGSAVRRVKNGCRISLAVSLIAGCHEAEPLEDEVEIRRRVVEQCGAGFVLEPCAVGFEMGISSAQSKQERAKEWALVDDTDGPDGLVCDDNVLASVALEDVCDGRELPLAHIHSLPPHRQQPQPLQAR